MITLILSGGGGERFWPLSRKSKPKQFLPLFGGKTLFSDALERANVVSSQLLIATNNLHEPIIQALGVESTLIIEPVGRNTCPAVALAAMACPPDETLLVLPSDHLIRSKDGFFKAVERAEQLAKDGFIVTFGIRPDYPETGYGYIESNGELVKSFREKPSLQVAESYLAAGNYYWNSGMFCFKASVFLNELEKHDPEVYQAALNTYQNAEKDEKSIRPSMEDMMQIPSISIDFSVIEKTDKLRVVPASMGWSDLGSFDSLSDEFNAHPNEQTCNEIVEIEAKNNFAFAPGKTVAFVGVSDLMVVETADAVLVCRKGASQNVRKVTDHLKKTNPSITEQ